MLTFTRRLMRRTSTPTAQVASVAKIAVEGNSAIFLCSDGTLYRKIYDEDGRGAGSTSVDLLTRLRLQPTIDRVLARAS